MITVAGQGEGPGRGGRPPLFLDQTEVRWSPKEVFGDGARPLFEGLDLPLD